MAKNYVEDGNVLTLIAPVGGVQSGVPAVIGDLVVVPLVDAAAGEPFAGKTGGVWSLPAAAGLTQGQVQRARWGAGSCCHCRLGGVRQDHRAHR